MIDHTACRLSPEVCKYAQCSAAGSSSGCRGAAYGGSAYSCGICTTGYHGNDCASCLDGFTLSGFGTSATCTCGDNSYVRAGACIPCGDGARSTGPSASTCVCNGTAVYDVPSKKCVCPALGDVYNTNNGCLGRQLALLPGGILAVGEHYMCAITEPNS